MKSICKYGALLFAVLILPHLSAYADISGKSRAEIINAFGNPSSALNSSTREILNYPQGQIVLVGGKVSTFKGTFNLDGRAAPSPQSAPTATVVTRPPSKPEPQTQTAPKPEERRSIQPFRWSHTLAEAKARSEKEGRPILALFTGPDWCGPCQQLEAEVLNTSEFNRLGRKKYIPLKIALYRNTYQSPEAKAEYNRLTAEYNIKGVPNFVILDSTGKLIGRPDIFKRRSGVSSMTEQVMTAIEEAEKGGIGGIPMSVKIGVTAVAVIGAFVFLRK